MKTIGIFPASGALGTSTYTHLLKLVPNDRVILINRYPEKVPQQYIQAGVKVRQASYESTPDELQAAFADVEVLFLISYPSHVHEYRSKVQIPAIDAARRAGVKHIFYSSLAFACDPSSAKRTKSSSRAVVMQAHLDSEAHLAKLALADPSFTYTAVREGLYAESFPIYTAFLDPRAPPADGAVRIPHDGSGPGVAWVKRDELGEATARLIARYCGAEEAAGGHPFPEKYVNGTVLLTGPRAWTLAETVDVLARAAGGAAAQQLRIREVSVDEYVRLPQVLAVFGSEEKARTWATAWEAIRDGETSVVSPELEEILGRKPEEFDVTIRNMYS
ncbi:hypothetical protein VTK56DRAFT_2708 [Thermocarpiscus australiensis]